MNWLQNSYHAFLGVVVPTRVPFNVCRVDAHALLVGSPCILCYSLPDAKDTTFNIPPCSLKSSFREDLVLFVYFQLGVEMEKQVLKVHTRGVTFHAINVEIILRHTMPERSIRRG